MKAVLPEELQRFIRDNIHSVEQLEVLLLLRSEAHRAWSAVDVSQRLFSVPTSAAMRLRDLHQRGLACTEGEAESLCYQYSPPSPDVDKIIASLDRAYRERKTTVIELIFSQPADNIQSFADAFRFRRKD